MVTNLEIDTGGNLESFNTLVLTNLRSLKIKFYSMPNEKEFLENLSQLQLTSLFLSVSGVESKITIGKHEKFNSMIYSDVCCSENIFKEFFSKLELKIERPRRKQ